jgi:hypothetical protein
MMVAACKTASSALLQQALNRAWYPLISKVPTSPAGRAKRKSAPAVGDPDRTRAASP